MQKDLAAKAEQRSPGSAGSSDQRKPEEAVSGQSSLKLSPQEAATWEQFMTKVNMNLGSTNTEKPSNREGDAPRYPASTFAPLSGDDDFMEEDEGKGAGKIGTFAQMKLEFPRKVGDNGEFLESRKEWSNRLSALQLQYRKDKKAVDRSGNVQTRATPGGHIVPPEHARVVSSTRDDRSRTPRGRAGQTKDQTKKGRGKGKDTDKGKDQRKSGSRPPVDQRRMVNANNYFADSDTGSEGKGKKSWKDKAFPAPREKGQGKGGGKEKGKGQGQGSARVRSAPGAWTRRIWKGSRARAYQPGAAFQVLHPKAGTKQDPRYAHLKNSADPKSRAGP